VRPTFPWIDQLKEAQANAAKLDRSLTTYGRVCKSQGFDASETLDARVEEVLRAIQIAKDIESQTGVKVPWQPFAGMETPKEVVEPETDDSEDDDAQSDEN
jgi:capsid protein